ncbi:hypothetical protein LWI29_014567 [Acer saccharum]|uniref:Uncharacterized protein n=1 Tax=Acer saccharum TaxID=4024 RepID=A0AA39W6B1_ACESA|nr:hypothetical protein LWI29_014567 [Acer saccharum]
MEELDEVSIDPEQPDHKVFIGSRLPDNIRKQLVEFLRERRNSFAWSHEDMIGIDPEVMVHRLQVDSDHQPVKQKRRKFAPERNKVINEEIQKLFDIGSVREVKYPDWLANVVVVKKKNGKWRVCIDFTDLNKACPKDSFPLPHVDMLVDATAGHKLLSFMDAYSGYNQILMHPDDQEKTAFVTERGIFCYKVMPFGLKNAGATYQRLVNKMFAKMLGSTMEVYIDDMLVKSLVARQHIDHLRQSFDVLDQYGMKLNPTKCSFGVSSGKFLGYLVTQRGVEANPDQIRSIDNLESPKCIKDVQKLTGRVAALNRFISKSFEKCLPFFNILRKNKAFEWNDDCEKALQELKNYLKSPPLLSKPKDNETLFIYLAVSDTAVSAVLVREEGSSQHPVYYVSKTLLDAETRYSRLEKLALALVMAARKLRPYFQCHSIKVLTAYPLKNILHKPELSGRLTKWAVELSEYDISFHPRSAMKSQVLADFIADFTPGESVQAEQELVALTETVTPGVWILSVDGSSSIKGSGLGLVLESPQGDILEQSVHCGFHATNNEAEYEALIAGLDLAKSLHVKIIKVRSDSQLVVRQVNGTYEARDQRMSAYLNKVKQLQSTFDEFSIEQIPRSENTRADALASLEILPDDKAEARRIKAKAAKFCILYGKLYKKSFTGPYLRCVTPREAYDVLKSLHQEECRNHSGARSLSNRAITAGYYWPTMRIDSQNHVKSCDKCQRFAPISHLPPGMLNSISAPWPFMKWGMDIVGKLPAAPGGVVYMLVLTDYFTKWVEIGAYQQVRDTEVRNFIWKNIICRFGVPKEIVTDNGSQFISFNFKNFYDKYAIKLSFSTPRYPQANGQAESTNKTIVNTLKKRLEAKKSQWAEKLPEILWSYRTTPRRSTGETPFSLVYGSEAVIPIETRLSTARNENPDEEQNNLELSFELDHLDERRDRAALRTQSYQQQVARHYNKKVSIRVFKLHDWVLRRVFQKYKGGRRRKIRADMGRTLPNNRCRRAGSIQNTWPRRSRAAQQLECTTSKTVPFLN